MSELILVECGRCQKFNTVKHMVAVLQDGKAIAVCASTCVHPNEHTEPLAIIVG